MPAMFEVRYAIRRLRRAPMFSAIVALTLALGIGANAAIFSIVNAVLFRPLPFGQPDELVTINHYYPSLPLIASVSAPGFQAYRDRTHSFSSVVATFPDVLNLTGVGEPERLRASRASWNYFSALGVTPAKGRAFRQDEDAEGKSHVVVLSDAYWRRRFGGREDVLNSDISLNGEPWTVIGIMGPAFADPFQRDTDLWTPLALPQNLFVPNNFTNEFMSVIARLKPGSTMDGAVREMEAFAEGLKKEYPNNFPPKWSLKTRSLMEVRTGSIRTALFVLLGAVGFVLLIACANVANLLLARAASREREVAIRTALGAARWDVVRQLLVECVVLAAAGGAIGLALAWGGVRALIALNPGNVPRIEELGLDWTVVGYTALLSVVTGLAFGLVPALRAAKFDLHSSLKEGSRGTSERSGRVLRRSLVVAEIALALTLLTGAGLLINSFARLSKVDPGFNASRLLTFNLRLPSLRYANDTVRRQFFAEVVPRIAALPGVKGVGATTAMPFGGGGGTGSFYVEGYDAPRGSSPWGDIRIVTPGFLETLQVKPTRGRVFDDRDVATVPRVAVVDEELVKKFFKPGDDPLGRHVYFGPNPPTPQTQMITIIGVVPHTKHEGLDADPRVQLYLVVGQSRNVNAMDFAVRTDGEPLAAVSSVRGAIQSVDRDLPLSQVRAMDAMIEASMGQRRLSMWMLGLFAGIALLLASLGVYGVMSYAVTQRARELGVRLALGASPGSVLGLVFRQGVALTGAGIVLGLVGAYALTRFIRGELFAVTATDPTTFVVVTGVLMLVACGATLVPAWRATRIDPIETLREE